MSRLTLALGLALLVVEAAAFTALIAVTGGGPNQWTTVVFIVSAASAFVVSGLVALGRRPENRTGVYLAATGYALFAAGLTTSVNKWIFAFGYMAEGFIWIPFITLVLAYPTGQLESRLERAIPLTVGFLLTTTAALSLLFDPTPAPDRCETCPESAVLVTDASWIADVASLVSTVGGLLIIGVTAVILARRWRAASPALRRLLWPVLASGSATFLAIGLVVIADRVSEQATDILSVAFLVSLTTVPLAFLFGILRMRLARSSAVDVATALQRGISLRDALAQALADPSVEILYRVDPGRGLGGEGWVDVDGHGIPAPASAPGRAVRYVEQDDACVAALVHDDSLETEPELVDAVTAAAAIALNNERLQAELRAEVRLAGAFAGTVPSLISNVDTDGRILRFNLATLKASGYDDEADIRGKHFWDVFIDPRERDEMIARFRAAAPDFAESEYENSFVNVRGEQLVIYWHSAPVVDEHGRVVSIVAGGLDITERKRREAEALLGAERLRAVIEGAPVAIVEIDLEHRVGLWNPAAERMFGWAAAEVLGRPLPLVPPDREQEFRDLVSQGRAGIAYTGFETKRMRRDGSLVEVELSAAPIHDVAGNVVGHMAVYSDITERQERRRQAERQRDFLHAITEAVPSFLVAVDPNAVVVEHNNNRSFLEAFGWTEEDIVGKSFLGLIAREDDHSARMAIANAANGVAQPERESQWFDRSGNELAVAWSARPVLDPDGRPLVLVSGTDVTVRRRQEQELRASRARILQAEDDARRKLERNLHDGAQQRLVALSVSLRLAESKLVTDPTKATELLAGAREELAHALEELRELARGIHPAVLTDRGLGPALEALIARAPFPVKLHTPEERLSSSVEAAAYYVVAESLTNVAKYARASTAVVAVSQRNGTVEVLVSDDGIGGADPGRGTGLKGLADRVSALDGTLRVESLAGTGTRIVAEIPLPETEE